MVLDCLRYGVFLVAISLPLAGCMETLGNPIYNYGPTSRQTCGGYTPTGADFVGYSCPRRE